VALRPVERQDAGVTLFFEERGTGRPVLFLHPAIADSRLWDPQWAAWASTYRLVRCDLPGFGQTPMRHGAIDPAGEVAAVLDELGLTGAVVVGCSYGGRLALELAVARPELVRALVLVGASLPGMEVSEDVRAGSAIGDEALARGDLDAASEAVVRLWVDGPRRGPDAVDPTVRTQVGAMWRRAYEASAPFEDSVTVESLVPDLERRLGEVRQPALVVVGTGDVEYIVRSADLLAAALPDARVATIPGAGHVPSLEEPAVFDALVLPFLAALVEPS
jgi:pimeloyl-ACP methyl ester carboxylesterase